MPESSPKPATAEPLGRRERSKRERRQRIRSAAAEMFAARGYAATTTQDIADAADVGTGTLFRYFPTKGDLLIDVMADNVTVGIERGLASAEAGADPVDAIIAMFAPLAQTSAQQPENLIAYLSETLFGPPNLRAIGAAHGTALAEAIGRILELHAQGNAVRPDVDLTQVADAIYGRLWLESIRLATQGQATDVARARRAVGFLVEGLLAP